MKYLTSIDWWQASLIRALKTICWKSQYKNVGLGQNKHVGLPTFLFCLFTRFLLRTEADLLTYMMVR